MSIEKNGKLRPSGKRSKLEETFSQLLAKLDCKEYYEVDKVKYIVPASNHTYLVDFTLPNKIQCELKGYLRDVDERRKYELIKEQHPEMDLRFVFAEPTKKISRTKMTHASWAEKAGFKWCGIRDVDTIQDWIKE
jgi:hypothetical protein